MTLPNFKRLKGEKKIMQLGEGKGKEYMATIIAFTICHIKVDAWILPANLVPKELRDCLHYLYHHANLGGMLVGPMWYVYRWTMRSMTSK